MDKLNWMYNKPTVDQEDYLLGKSLDTRIIKVAMGTNPDDEEEDRKLCRAPGSKFTGSFVSNTVDMATKIREDPLFLIRKHEADAKRELIRNPVKMKKVKDLLEKRDKKKAKEHTIEKLKRLLKAQVSSSSDDNQEHDGIRSASQKAARKTERQDDHSRSVNRRASNHDSVKSSKRHYKLDHDSEKSSKRPYGAEGTSRSGQTGQFDVDVKTKPGTAYLDHQHRDKSDGHQTHFRDRTYVPDKSASTRSSRVPEQNAHSSSLAMKSNTGNDRSRDHETIRPKRHSELDQGPRRQNVVTGLSKEELHRRRQEMMDNAKSHSKSRKRRHDDRQDREILETAELKQNYSRDEPNFLVSAKMTEETTLEDRIKRTIHNVQRTRAAMDNFL